MTVSFTAGNSTTQNSVRLTSVIPHSVLDTAKTTGWGRKS